MGTHAVGKTVRLIVDEWVAAEDVVGPDGSFVLHPREDRAVSGRVYLEAGTSRMSLANDYASWIQDHLNFRAEVNFGCGPQPADAGAEEATTTRLPPPSLIPKLH